MTVSIDVPPASSSGTPSSETLLHFCVLLSVHFVFFCAPWLFFTRRTSEYQRPIAVLWSLTAMVCASFWNLLLFEVMDVLSYETRYNNWKLNLDLVLLLLIFVIPCYLFYLLASKFVSNRRSANITWLTVFGLWLGLFYFLGDPSPIVIVRKSEHGPLSIEHLVSALSFFGVTLFAVLSGFGAVNAIHSHWRHWRGFYQRQDLRSLEHRQARVLEHINERQRRLELAELELQYAQDSCGSVSSSPQPRPLRRQLSRLMRRVARAVHVAPPTDAELHEQQARRLRAEIRCLEDQHSLLATEIEEVRVGRAQAGKVQTCIGRGMRGFGYIFACFCLVKLCGGVYALFFGPPKNDLISSAIQTFLLIVDIRMDIDRWSQVLSFIFVGCIVITQLRNVLNQITTLLDPSAPADSAFPSPMGSGRSSPVMSPRGSELSLRTMLGGPGLDLAPGLGMGQGLPRSMHTVSFAHSYSHSGRISSFSEPHSPVGHMPRTVFDTLRAQQTSSGSGSGGEGELVMPAGSGSLLLPLSSLAPPSLRASRSAQSSGSPGPDFAALQLHSVSEHPPGAADRDDAHMHAYGGSAQGDAVINVNSGGGGGGANGHNGSRSRADSFTYACEDRDTDRETDLLLQNGGRPVTISVNTSPVLRGGAGASATATIPRSLSLSSLSMRSPSAFMIDFRTMLTAADLRRNSAIMGLFIAEVLGMYMLSAILLLRKNLPRRYRQIVTNVFGDIEFSVFHRFFDFLLIGSAALSILLILRSRKRVNRTKAFERGR